MKQAVLHVVSPIKPFCVTINEKDTLHTIRDMLSERCSFLLQHSYSLTVNGLNMCDTALLHSMNPLEFPLNIQVRLLTLGGKGGFGANLKSQGGRNAWKKSDNFESCRDLSGRRIKTVNEAKLLADYIEAEPERRKLKEEQLRKKVEREQRRKNTSHKKMKAEEFGSDFEDEHEKALTGISSAVERAIKSKLIVKAKSEDSAPTSKKMVIAGWDQDSSDESDADVAPAIEVKRKKGKGRANNEAS